MSRHREELRKETATKIHGQPTDHDVILLEKELIAIAVTIPTTLGGGNHGHAGLIVEPTKYLTMTGGIANLPSRTSTINAAAGTRAREEALHKELIAQYEIHKGVEQALKDIIIEVVKPKPISCEILMGGVDIYPLPPTAFR